MPVHICHLTSVHSADDPRIFLKECRSLAHAGFKVTLIALRGTQGEFDGVAVKVLPFSGGRLKRMLQGTRQIFRAAIGEDADIYHFHDPELLPTGVRLIKLGKRVIYDSHEDLPRQLKHKHYIPKLIAGFIAGRVEKFEDRHARRLSAIVTATDHIRERFARYHNTCITLRNYPRLDELSDVHGQPGTRTLCYIGSITESRGIRQMLDALHLVDAQLLLGGKFSPPALQQEATLHPAWKKVTYLGFLNRDGVRSALAQSAIGLVPLHPSPGYSEALPVKMFEYMAAGIPVITSDIPLWRQILETNHCGSAVNVFDPRQFADTINAYLSDPTRALNEGTSGRNAVLSTYNWETEVVKLIELCKSLVR
ncbi:MAG: glycosyltransferase family 4 protein [Flavobacteriales bacterium]|nr:glycosyltransferase family 4 protein [Flavobacteriales bacterium]